MSDSAALPASQPQQGSTEASLRGRGLALARGIWLAIALFCLVVWVVGMPFAYADLGKVCTVPPCDQNPLPESIPVFQASGLSLGVYAAYTGTVEMLFALLYIVMAALIFWRKSNTWIGLLTSLFLITFGVSQTDGDNVIKAVPALADAISLLLPIGFVCLALFLYLFPDGHFVPRWTRWVTLGWIPLFVVSSNLLPELGFGLMLFGFLALSLYAQVYRYRHVSTPTQRQQTKWVVFGTAAFMLGTIIILLISNVFTGPPVPGTYDFMFGNTLFYAVQACIPLSLGIAILRSRLWDIDVIINKALVYGSLTGLLGALYAGLIIGLTSLAEAISGPAGQEPLALVMATLVIAALFQPLRKRLQALIDRRFYRRKYDAEKTLLAFSAALRNEVDLNHLRGHLVAVVQETMQPASVSLWLRMPEQRETGSTQPPQPHRLA